MQASEVAPFMPTSEHPAAPPAATKSRRAVWMPWVAGAGLVALVFFLPVRQVADPTLDNSNYASYAYFTASGFHYGTEVMPMAGPYGFVPYGFLYAGKLFGKRFLLELLTKLALGALVMWFFRRAGGGWIRWVWLGGLLATAPLVEDLPYDLAILLTGLCLLETAAVGRARWLGGLLAIFLALLTLYKGTQAMLGLAVLLLLGLQAAGRRDFRPLGWFAGCYAAGLAGFLALAGQNPLDFPRYLRGVFELSSGYNAAMMIEEPRAAFLSGVGALLALESMAALTLWNCRRNPALATGTLLLAAYSFIQWKHGFVRGDGHIYIFYQYASVAALTLWLFVFPAGGARAGRGLRAGIIALGLCATALGLWGDGAPTVRRLQWALTELPAQVRLAARQIGGPAATKAGLDAELDRRRALYDLPVVRAWVGRATIDYFGTDHGYLTLNRLDYRPRPMGGGPFNVFTPWLHDLNVRRLADPATRPDYFLVRPETIDERFLAQDDAGTLRALLALYEPVATEQGMVLFRKIPGASLPAPRLFGEQALAPGQSFTLPELPPDQMLAIELDLPLTLIGRLRALLYKPPLLFLNLEGEGLVRPVGRRVIPACFARPVLLNPVIESVADMIDVSPAAPGKHARTISLQSGHPGWWHTAEWKIRFYSVPRPGAAPAAADLRLGLRFPTATRPPTAMQPPNAPLRIFDGLLVQMLAAPASVRFPVTPADNGVRFTYGLDPAAYTDGGRTDGMEFIVELERPGQPAQLLLRQHLRPAAVPADRPYRVEHLVLPPVSPGSTLVLRTTSGPGNEGAWDWGFFSGINFRSGGYRLEQFPGFNRVPVAVDAAVCGSFRAEGRPVFMLNAPGAVSFRLTGTERQVAYSAGLLPGAYTNGGQSDGVEFLIELQAPDGTATLLSRHRLDPGGDESDRGDRSYNVSLPATPPNTLLILKVTPGPQGNGAWDWSYVARLEIR